MFRNTSNSVMSVENFGIGSTITAGPQYLWLVIRSYDKLDSITLLNMRTMVPSNKLLQVVDIHYLTEEEARKLADMANPEWAFTDFDCHAMGFKTK